MGDRRTLRILHLSDLHIGKERTSGWRMRRVLGEAWSRNLREIAADGPVDLVCFTGDLAQSGQATQYEEASRFVDEVLSVLKVPKSRFFCVPGNHDVDRTIALDAWREMRDGAWEVSPQAFARWLAGGRAPRGFDAAWPEALVQRQAAYRDWLDAAGLSAQRPEHGPHGRFGYRISLADLGLEAPLHVVGLDSAWLAGDDDDAGKLRLTDEQVVRLLTDERGERLPGWTIALVHHPLSDLADGREAQRLLSEFGVSLLLHGHLHDAEVSRWTTPAASLHVSAAGSLHVSAAGSLYETDQFPNSVQLLDVQLPKGRPIEPRQLWARSWSTRGFWKDDSFYPGSVGGKLRLGPPDPPDTPPDMPFIPGEFVGRTDELARLRRALLPEDGSARRPTVLCCAIEGMAGVGKTRLAEHFVERYWLPALDLPADTEPAAVHLRLLLDPLAPIPPTATDLGQRLADRLRSTGPTETLWPRLVAALKVGPHGSRPWLLLIENVDAQAQAQAVGELVNRLPGCPILVTARFQKLGGAGWTRVPVAPMSERDARELLLSETHGQDGHPLTATEADDLAQRLGRLPLALHIAASHLNLGLTPKAFLAELRQTGLDLPPAEPGDPRLSADRARAIVRSSFELSWRHWCSGRGADPAWQQALVALAHGPISHIGLPLSATITALEEDTYPSFAAAAARLSLLQYTPATQHSQLHPLIAEFLRLQPEPTEDVVVERLSSWFIPLLPKTGDARQRIAWDLIWQEIDALIHWLAVVPGTSAHTIAIAGKSFSSYRGPYAVWLQFCDRMIAAHDDFSILSDLLFMQAQVAIVCVQLELASDAAHKKEEIDLDRGFKLGFAYARGIVGDVLAIKGKWSEAIGIWRDEVLPVCREKGDAYEQAATLSRIAGVRKDMAEYDEALNIWRNEVLPQYEVLADLRGQAMTRGCIAGILQLRKKFDEALKIRENEIILYKEIGDVRGCAVAESEVAKILKDSGSVDKAIKVWRDIVLPVYIKLGDVRERAMTFGFIADALYLKREYDEAVAILRNNALPICEKIGDIRALVVGRTNLATYLNERGLRRDRNEINILLRRAYGSANMLNIPEKQAIALLYKKIFRKPIEI